MTFTSDLIRSNQERLADLGYYLSNVDGVSGPATENAMSRFKAANGLAARPFPGPITMMALWNPAAKAAPKAVQIGNSPAWLTEAKSLLGTREVPGSANNPVIMGWAKNLDQWYPGDDVPWCGLFVAHCMAAGAPDEPQNFNRLGARNWLQYGENCPEWLGAVAVFWRTHKTKSFNGHVGLLTGVSASAVRIVGGNQSDNVTETWISRDRLLGFRKPVGWEGVDAPTAVAGVLSVNEA